jgi:hypothetical protein
MQTLYRKILDLELWHDYCLGQPDPQKPLPDDYDISGLLAIVPTPDCQRMLKNLRWVFRPQSHGATIFAEVEVAGADQFQTKLPIDRPEHLTFWLVVRDPRFANFTNLPLTASPDRLYYFSNLSGNSQGQTLFLTQCLPAYVRDTAYHVGQLVTHGGKTWEALRDRVATRDDPRREDWESLPNSQYVSEQDQLPRQARLLQAHPGEILQLTLVNVNQQASLAFEFRVPETHPEGAAIAIPLNFSPQPPGRYQLHQPGTKVKSNEFILVDPMVARDAWGLIEIELHPSLLPPAFSLVQQVNGKTLIQPRTYVIRFKNRATHWRYRYERPHGFTKEKLLTLNFQYDTDKTYFTQRPQGLLQRPSFFFMDGKDRLLPAPRVTQIKPESQIDPETQEKTIAIFSDIYL